MSETSPPRRIRTYEDAVAYLYGLVNYERTPMPYRKNELKLGRMHALVDALGLSDPAVPSVHVAGTKGKGSVCAMLAGVLCAAGYRTGRFTSPHLRRIEERLWVDHEVATAQQFVDLTRTVADAADRATSTAWGRPTYFEHLTAMAMAQFRCRRVQAAVFEVGLGGRLDSTNVITPRVCVISSISRDHVRQLGRSLHAIAREKAGIIKPGVPTVCGVRHPSPRRQIERVAHDCGSPLVRLGHEFHVRYRGTVCVPGAGLRCQLDYRFGDDPWQLWEVGLGGRHQADNAAVVLACARLLADRGLPVPEPHLRDGLCHVHWPGRLEVVRTDPVVLIDCAHNLASIKASTATVREVWPDPRRVVVFGCSEGKDLRPMLTHLTAWADHLILTRSENPRALSPTFLARHLPRAVRCEVVSIPSYREAIDTALAHGARGAGVLITGSVFVAGDAREHLAAPDRPAAV